MAQTLRPWLKDVIGQEIVSLIEWCRQQDHSSDIKPEPDSTSHYTANGSTLRSELSSTSLRIDCPVQLVRVLNEKQPVTFIVSDSKHQLNIQLTPDAVARFEREIDAELTTALKGDIILLRRFSVVLTNIGPSASRIKVNALDLDYVTTQRKLIGQPVPLTQSTRIADLVHQYKGRTKPVSAEDASRPSLGTSSRLPALTTAVRRASASPDQIIASQVPQTHTHASNGAVPIQTIPGDRLHATHAPQNPMIRKRKRPSSPNEDIFMQSGVNLAQPRQASSSRTLSMLHTAPQAAPAHPRAAPVSDGTVAYSGQIHTRRDSSHEAQQSPMSGMQYSSATHLSHPHAYAAVLAQRQQLVNANTAQYLHLWQQTHNASLQPPQPEQYYQRAKQPATMSPWDFRRHPHAVHPHVHPSSLRQYVPLHHAHAQDISTAHSGPGIILSDARNPASLFSHPRSVMMTAPRHTVTEVHDSSVLPIQRAVITPSIEELDARLLSLVETDWTDHAVARDHIAPSTALNPEVREHVIATSLSGSVLPTTVPASPRPTATVGQPQTSEDIYKKVAKELDSQITQTEQILSNPPFNPSTNDHTSPVPVTKSLSIRSSSQPSPSPSKVIQNDRAVAKETPPPGDEFHSVANLMDLDTPQETPPHREGALLQVTVEEHSSMQPASAQHTSLRDANDDSRQQSDAAQKLEALKRSAPKETTDSSSEKAEVNLPIVNKEKSISPSADPRQDSVSRPPQRYFIPQDQAALLEKPSSWIPPPIGQEFPHPNVPIALLKLWNKSQVDMLRRSPKSSSLDRGGQASTASINDGETTSQQVDKELAGATKDSIRSIEVGDDDSHDDDYLDEDNDDSDDDSHAGGVARLSAAEHQPQQPSRNQRMDVSDDSSELGPPPSSPSPALDRELPDDSDTGDEIVVSTQRYQPIYARQAASTRNSTDLEEAVPQALPTPRKALKPQPQLQQQPISPQRLSPDKRSPTTQVRQIDEIRGPSESHLQPTSSRNTVANPTRPQLDVGQPEIRMTQKSAVTLLSLINRDMEKANSSAQASASPLTVSQASHESKHVQSMSNTSQIVTHNRSTPERIVNSKADGFTERSSVALSGSRARSVHSLEDENQTSPQDSTQLSSARVSTPIKQARRTLPNTFVRSGKSVDNRPASAPNTIAKGTSGHRNDIVQSNPKRSQKNNVQTTYSSPSMRSGASHTAIRANSQQSRKLVEKRLPSNAESSAPARQVIHISSSGSSDDADDNEATDKTIAGKGASRGIAATTPGSTSATTPAMRLSTPTHEPSPDIADAGTPTKLQEFAANWMDIGPGGAFATDDAPGSRQGWKLSVLSWSL